MWRPIIPHSRHILLLSFQALEAANEVEIAYNYYYLGNSSVTFSARSQDSVLNVRKFGTYIFASLILDFLSLSLSLPLSLCLFALPFPLSFSVLIFSLRLSAGSLLHAWNDISALLRPLPNPFEGNLIPNFCAKDVKLY